MKSEHKLEMKSRARNIALTVAYDGTNYEGFQRQSNGRAIQNILERKLEKIFGDSIELAASGRTDSGVHARGQVVNFFSNGSIPIEKIPVAVNSILPPDIVILDAREVDREFSARHDVVSKIYSYSIYTQQFRDPFLDRFALLVKNDLDLELMNLALDKLIGTHDFSSFKSANNVEMNPVRRIISAEIKNENDRLTVLIHANGFLYHMARNIVGSLLKIGKHELSIDQFEKIFESRDHSLAPWIAPARGLCLEKVFYDQVKNS
ncbi:MAG: tRNA pseudouridine(38-40) synthase TruA [Selenomonadaceae bacterium]|nr:tRNA pseudouridine(38-40) synthase TruA [Selenomonadaceae bacterium]